MCLVPAAHGASDADRAGAARVLAVQLPASGGGRATAANGEGPRPPVSAPPPAAGPPAGGPHGDGPPPPLGLVQRLAWSFRLLCRNRLALLVLWVVWAAASGALTAALGALAPAMPWQESDPLALIRAAGSPLSVLVLGAWALVSLLLWSWLQAALLILPLRWFEQGARPPVAALMRQAWARAPTVAAAMVLVGGATTLVALAPVPVVGLRPASAGAAAPLLVSLAAAMVLGVALALVLPAAANEPLGATAALGRGWRLARHRWGRIAVSGLAFALLGALGFLLVQVLLATLAAAVAAVAPLAALAVPLLMFVLMPLGAAVLAVAGVFLVALLYVEARVEGDGWRPPWRVVPHPEWPCGEGAAEPAAPAGPGRAWRDFALAGGAAVMVVAALSLWGADALRHRSVSPSPASGSAGLVSGGGARVDQGPEVAAGPGEGAGGLAPEIDMRIDTFFPSERDPQVWIRVTARNLMAGLPVLPEDYVRLRVHAVRDAGGGNRFNAGSSFEGEFFERLQWSGDLDAGEAQALRTVHLLPGTRESDVVEIDGELIVSRPVGVRALDLTAADLGQARTAPGGAGRRWCGSTAPRPWWTWSWTAARG